MKEQIKIGILTLHRALNYGAAWQCWALKKACESYGHIAETIDYNPWGDFKAKWAIGRRPFMAYKYLMQLYRFNKFVENRLKPTTHTESHEWIKQNPPQDDIYIVGSDQVWANEIVGDFLDSYLLDFAPKYVKRIAYAASTAGNTLQLTEYQLGELRKFSAISLREKQSVEEVQKNVRISVTDVCDPSMLLTMDDYQPMEQKQFCIPKHYIAYYNLAGDSFCEESAKLVGKSTGLPIVNIASKYVLWAKRNYPAPTPEQWIYMLHHADFVVTNSFHGVAFSIVFRRPFIYCAAQNSGHSNRTGRIMNLLTQTHLLGGYTENIKQVQEIVNHGGVHYDESAIEDYHNRSLGWLKNAIEL